MRTVLFDLDGTLIDSLRLILASYRHTMRTHLGHAPPDDAWLSTMGTPLIAQLRDFARDEQEVCAMRATYMDHNRMVHDRLVRSFHGVRDTVEWLVERSYRVGVVTSKARGTALRGLAACGLERAWFGAVVTSDDPVPPKPDPAPVRLALERLGEESAARAIFVGDSVWDLRAGRAAGTATAAALWGPFEESSLAVESPDHWLADVGQLRELLMASA